MGEKGLWFLTSYWRGSGHIRTTRKVTVPRPSVRVQQMERHISAFSQIGGAPLFENIFRELLEPPDFEYARSYDPIVRVHHNAAGAKGRIKRRQSGDRATVRSCSCRPRSAEIPASSATGKSSRGSCNGMDSRSESLMVRVLQKLHFHRKEHKLS